MTFLNPKACVSVRDMMGEPLLIVDDFYSDPDSVRDNALSCAYSRPEYGNFPGKTAHVPTEAANVVCKKITEYAEKYFQKSIGFKIPIDMESRECYYQSIDVPWDEVDEAYKIPHVDYRFRKGLVTVPALIYLNKPEQCVGGTAFYKNVETNLFKIRSVQDFHFVYRNSPDSSWIIHNTVQMKYNRLVMYNGNMMHTAFIKPNYFGTEIENCRLTQNIFLHMHF